MKQHLYIVRGLSGSGKTTVAQNLIAEFNQHGVDAVLVESDQFFMSVSGVVEKYNFDRRFLGAAHDECYGKAMRYLREGKTVIVANTFSTNREIERYINGLQRCGMKNSVNVQVIKCVGNFTSAHSVPQKVIDRMRERWEDFDGEIVYDHTA